MSGHLPREESRRTAAEVSPFRIDGRGCQTAQDTPLGKISSEAEHSSGNGSRTEYPYTCRRVTWTQQHTITTPGGRSQVARRAARGISNPPAGEPGLRENRWGMPCQRPESEVDGTLAGINAYTAPAVYVQRQHDLRIGPDMWFTRSTELDSPWRQSYRMGKVSRLK